MNVFKKHKKFDYQINNLLKAFTLSEVLMTLGIIGVVAALTIPVLIKKYEQMQTLSQLQKAYTSLSAAFNQAQTENGLFDTWGFLGWGNPSVADTIFSSTIVPKLNVAKNCGYTGWQGTKPECWAYGCNNNCSDASCTPNTCAGYPNSYSIFIF